MGQRDPLVLWFRVWFPITSASPIVMSLLICSFNSNLPRLYN